MLGGHNAACILGDFCLPDLLAYVALIVFFAAVGAAAGAALVQSGLASPVLVIPGYGPVELAMAALLGGTIVGFLAATQACGAIFTLIAIASNTRRTSELLAARLPGP
jgi:hypothetical protein